MSVPSLSRSTTWLGWFATATDFARSTAARLEGAVNKCLFRSTTPQLPPSTGTMWTVLPAVAPLLTSTLPFYLFWKAGVFLAASLSASTQDIMQYISNAVETHDLAASGVPL